MDGIENVLNKTKQDVEKSHANGKIPADYSLGFLNALVFCDHHLNLRQGDPVFYERTTSVGSLPKPVVLNSGNALHDEKVYQFLCDDAMLQARGIIDNVKFEEDTMEITDKAIIQIKALKKALETMEKFVDQKMEEEENGIEKSKEVESQAHGSQGAESIKPKELEASQHCN